MCLAASVLPGDLIVARSSSVHIFHISEKIAHLSISKSTLELRRKNSVTERPKGRTSNAHVFHGKGVRKKSSNACSERALRSRHTIFDSAKPFPGALAAWEESRREDIP
jgi:hypothetical protein